MTVLSVLSNTAITATRPRCANAPQTVAAPVRPALPARTADTAAHWLASDPRIRPDAAVRRVPVPGNPAGSAP